MYSGCTNIVGYFSETEPNKRELEKVKWFPAKGLGLGWWYSAFESTIRKNGQIHFLTTVFLILSFFKPFSTVLMCKVNATNDNFRKLSLLSCYSWIWILFWFFTFTFAGGGKCFANKKKEHSFWQLLYSQPYSAGGSACCAANQKCDSQTANKKLRDGRKNCELSAIIRQL